MGVGFLLVAVAPGGLAQSAPDSTVQAAADDPLRGGAFEFGAVFGLAAFEGKSELESCFWTGLRAGHRFEPFAGNERLQLGFRAGWETCFTEHATEGRVDLIYINAAFNFGLRAGRSWLLYWDTGLGEMLGDSTVGDGGEVEPRLTIRFGPGATWALSRRFLLDFSVYGILWEAFKLGTDPGDPPGGTTFGIMPNLMVAIQI